MHCSVNLINRLKSTNNINSTVSGTDQCTSHVHYTQGLQMAYSREQNLILEITCNVFLLSFKMKYVPYNKVITEQAIFYFRDYWKKKKKKKINFNITSPSCLLLTAFALLLEV